MDYTKYVNVFQGCGEINLPKPQGIAATWLYIKGQTGNTVPNATLPFGKISCGLYTGGYPTGYINHKQNYCGRVRKFENKMIGISHMHHSGTGAVGHYYNYVVVTPKHGELAPVSESYGEEYAVPGYYRCRMLESGILCETTVSQNVAYHRYSLEKEAKLIIDFSNNGILNFPGLDDLNSSEQQSFSYAKSAHIDIVSENEMLAVVVMNDIPLYVHIYCEGDIKNTYLWRDYKRVQFIDLTQETEDKFGGVFEVSGTCVLKVAIALTGHEKANEYIKTASEDFDTVRAEASKMWNKYLSRIDIDTDDDIIREIFYSNFYHSIVKPCNWENDSFIYGDGPFFCDFITLWDMYKTQLPFVFSLYREEGRAIAETFLRVRKEIGFFPPSISLSEDMNNGGMQSKMLMCYSLADAYYRGYVSADVILQSVWTAIQQNEQVFIATGMEKRYSHIMDLADICGSMKKIAEESGNTQYAEKFSRYEGCWRNAFDSKTGLCSMNSYYYEGTNQNYSFRLLNAIKERISLCGRNKYLSLLDDFFGYTRTAVTQPDKPNDCSAIKKMNIQSFEGFNNETDMETPFSYVFAGRQDRTCEIVRAGMKYMFTTGRGGLPGNNDSGALSSCYIFNAMGIFPVSGQNLMLIGSPILNGATLHLENNKLFSVKVYNNSDKNIYVQKAVLNGRIIYDKMFTVTEFMQGGTLELYMSNKTNSINKRKWHNVKVNRTCNSVRGFDA